ncbi:MAG: Gfo/Idh/MocA family oxidoreductase [Verrucomicrobiota bacterium]
MKRKRYVAVGTGGRIVGFIDPIVRDFRETCELVALCDLSQTRMDYHRHRLAKDYNYAGEIKTYLANDFDRMLDEVKPDAVIVCTTDATHHEYIIRSANKGYDVICEKPMTTDAEKCRAILEAVEKSGRDVRVTFNMRWSPGITKVRELLRDGKIGKIHHVQMEYLLDTSHGADYYRRWHSDKASSGGLLVHKSTHHFDLVNWWIDSIPKNVYAQGDLVFYGKKNAIARGDEKLTQYERYTGVEAAKDDPFRLDLSENENSKGLYLDAEKETGYLRDRNIFRDGIDIEDTMSVIVKYRSGTTLNYSLNTYCPWEGFRVNFTGDKGRIEYEEVLRPHIIIGQSDEEFAAQYASISNEPYRIKFMPLFKPVEIIEVPKTGGSHGGADPLIQRDIFGQNSEPDPFSRGARYEQGAASALIGIAANQSIATHQQVDIGKLVTLRPEAIRLSELK